MCAAISNRTGAQLYSYLEFKSSSLSLMTLTLTKQLDIF